MQLIITRCYNGFLGASIVISTLLTWPIILLLQKNSKTRDWYYSQIFGILSKTFAKLGIEPKSRMFDSMNEHYKRLTETGNVVSVLEIGPGNGDNFKYYKYPIKLTVIDMNPFLERTAQKLATKYPLVNIVDSQIANAENMTCFEDNSFDIVCGTLIMCCIKDNHAALSEIHRVLKPNGRFFYLEGNRMQTTRSIFLRFVQSFVAKFWTICEYGCKFMHNNFDGELKSSKLHQDWHRIYRVPECAIGHEVHYGCAVKI